MKKTLFILVFAVFQITAVAQVPGWTLSGTPADIIIDARSIALGESLAANPIPINSYLSNPASLSRAKELSVFYNRRSFNWLSFDNTDLYYYSAGVILPLSIGNFSLSYSKFLVDFRSTGIYSTSSGEQYYSTMGISYSREIVNNLSGGISVKFLDFGNEARSEMEIYKAVNERSLTPLLDFGILYTIPDPFIKNDQRIKDKMNLGLSVQNLGAKAKYRYEFNGMPNFYGESPVTQYLRFGFSYNLNFLSGEGENIFSTTISGEYRNQINPQEYEKSFVDNFGIGLEAGLFEIVYLRIGGIVRNGSSVLYNNGEMKVNYGFGVSLPASLIAENLPLRIGFDYGVTTQNMGDSMPAFNLNLNYGIKLF